MEQKRSVFFGWNVLLIFCLTWDPGDVTLPCSSSDLSRNIWQSDESDFQNVHRPVLSPAFPILCCARTHSHKVREYIMVLSMRLSNLYYFLLPGVHVETEDLLENSQKEKADSSINIFQFFKMKCFPSLLLHKFILSFYRFLKQMIWSIWNHI